MKRYKILPFLLLTVVFINCTGQEDYTQFESVSPVRSEIIQPTHKNQFREPECPQRKQGGNPRMINGYLLFDGALDGNRQVDPQIAVGGEYVFHGTNSGLIVYDKEGNYIDGVSQKCFNNGIDPKLFFDPHNRVFGFDLWVYWDSLKVKPVNIAVSETDNPLGAWNIYPISASQGVDGGGIGFSKKWIAYSFPGGKENTFVLKMSEAIAGKPATVFHFGGSLGHPVFTQDNIEDLYFFKIDGDNFVITRVTANENGEPVAQIVSNEPHKLENIGWPPKSAQKGTDQVVSSGDRNPKNLVLQNGCIWFSQAVNYHGKSAVQWHQLKLNGSIVQTGLISSPVNNYIQTTIAVNKNEDVLIGFQEAGADMFISPRMAFRYAYDPKGEVREVEISQPIIEVLQALAVLRQDLD